MSKKPRRPGIALLGVADTYVDAMMWKDMLEQQSIPCMVRDGSATNADLGGGFAGMGALPGGGRLEVYVPASALERSRDILGPSLLPTPARETTPAGAAISTVWLLWILGPLFVAGTLVFVAIALGAI
jgi:hypothetical protein